MQLQNEKENTHNRWNRNFDCWGDGRFAVYL